MRRHSAAQRPPPAPGSLWACAWHILGAQYMLKGHKGNPKMGEGSQGWGALWMLMGLPRQGHLEAQAQRGQGQVEMGRRST